MKVLLKSFLSRPNDLFLSFTRLPMWMSHHFRFSWKYSNLVYAYKSLSLGSFLISSSLLKTCQLVRNIRFYQISFSDPQLLQIVLKHFLDLAIESEDRSENSFSVLLLLLIVWELRIHFILILLWSRESAFRHLSAKLNESPFISIVVTWNSVVDNLAEWLRRCPAKAMGSPAWVQIS